MGSVTEFEIKALSRKAVLDSSETFQLTASTKSFDSVLWQLQALQCGLVYCLHVVLYLLLARRGYWDFQEAGYKLSVAC